MKVLILVFCIFFLTASAGAQQQPTPCTPTPKATPEQFQKPREGRLFLLDNSEKSGGEARTNARMLQTLNTQSNINCPNNDARVAEHVTVKEGPVGEVYLVSGLNDFIKVDSGRTVSHIYPSLIFDMSASPLYKLNDGGDTKKKRKAENTKLDFDVARRYHHVDCFLQSKTGRSGP